MYSEIPCYTYNCDGCNKNVMEWADYCWHPDKESVRDEMHESNWQEDDINNKFYCDECWKEWDEDEWECEYIFKTQWRVKYAEWDRKWLPYVSISFSTKEKAREYLIAYEWDIDFSKDHRFEFVKDF